LKFHQGSNIFLKNEEGVIKGKEESIKKLPCIYGYQRDESGTG